MQWGEFRQRAEAEGVRLPYLLNRFWDSVLDDLENPGSGNPRNYTEAHLIRLKAWRRVHDFCSGFADGRPDTNSAANDRLLRDVVDELLEHTDGYIIITERMVSWSSSVTLQTFVGGAVVIPV